MTKDLRGTIPESQLPKPTLGSKKPEAEQTTPLLQVEAAPEALAQTSISATTTTTTTTEKTVGLAAEPEHKKTATPIADLFKSRKWMATIFATIVGVAFVITD